MIFEPEYISHVVIVGRGMPSYSADHRPIGSKLRSSAHTNSDAIEMSERDRASQT